MNIDNLTIEQKIKLLAGKNFWQTEDLDGKLYQAVVSDGPVGVRKTPTPDWDGSTVNTKELPAVAYPSIEVLSQTWDRALSRAMGECLADDCIEKGVDVLLAPGVNIKRSPICGRNFEYPSEDPFLAGECAKEYINGIQSKHVGATLKHYLANNNEVGRKWTSSNVDERTLREIYMRNFEIALSAKPWAVMSSYNKLNGVQVSQNKEYNDHLRNDLGFGDGLIMSDWDAVIDHTASVKSGLDLEMPYNEQHYEQLLEDYANGKITEEEIDACVKRVVAFAERCEKESKLRRVSRSIEARRAVAQKIAADGAVLLKNNGILPIKNGQSVAVTQHDFNKYYAGGGSAKVVPEKEIRSLAETIKDVLPDSIIDCAQMLSVDHVRAFTNADGKDVSIVLAGCETTEGRDRVSLDLKYRNNEDWFIKTVAKRNKNTVVVLFGGGAIDVSEWIDDVAAVLYVGYAGEMGGEAIADILVGKVNPSGKLTETFAKTREDYPSENIEFDGLNYNYTEGLDVGYRYFDKHPEKVRFPFGFGLSYTQFRYSDITVDNKKGKYTVSFDIENTGDRDGAEIAQVYVSAINSSVEKPIKELRGFEKIFLKPAEKKRVEITLDSRSFSHYDVNNKTWVTDIGEYEIIVAQNSQKKVLSERVAIK